jgi:hypothetical protein
MLTKFVSAAGAASLLLLAGCGGSSSSAAPSASGGSSASSSPSSSSSSSSLEGLSGTEVLGKAKTAFTGASSVHVVLHAKGDKGEAVGYDVRYAKGKGASGTLNAGTGEIKLLAIGDDVYFSGDAKALAQFGASGAAGTWFKTTKSSTVGQALTQLTDVNQLAEQVFKPSGAIEVVDGKDVDGKPTVGLLDKGADGGTLYVAAEGEAYPLLIEPPAAKKDQGDARFTEYGAPVDLTPPATFTTLPGA